MSRSSNVRLMETWHAGSRDFGPPVYPYPAPKSGSFIYQHKRSEFS
jgi:hypothetical protein